MTTSLPGDQTPDVDSLRMDEGGAYNSAMLQITWLGLAGPACCHELASPI